MGFCRYLFRIMRFGLFLGTALGGFGGSETEAEDDVVVAKRIAALEGPLMVPRAGFGERA